jgi:hypothetical protein
MNATHLWSHWQGLFAGFSHCFTVPGSKRFVEWITGLCLNVEEHTITQSVTAIERIGDWKALETFAETGAWDGQAVEDALARLIEHAPGRIWYGYHVSAVDDTKVHRSSADVWGTCTFHEYTARCPNRAATVRAHNWVVLGALLENPDQPAWFLPQAGRLYFRKSQLPGGKTQPSQQEPFRTKCELAVELLRAQTAAVGGLHLGVFDGGYALRSVVRPLVLPEPGSGHPRIEFLTRLRHDARLADFPPTERKPGQRGPLPKWGKALPPPRQGGRWKGPWRVGHAFLYGRRRKVLWKEVVCLWRVLGNDVPVKAVVAKVEGYKKRFTLVSSAVSLTGLVLVELFAARFRQEDGFRDLKQRLGWEECRAWTENPIRRTSQAQWVAMSMMRLLQFRLESQGDRSWYEAPPWNRKKDRASVLDVERLLRRYRGGILQCLSDWLGERRNSA